MVGSRLPVHQADCQKRLQEYGKRSLAELPAREACSNADGLGSYLTNCFSQLVPIPSLPGLLTGNCPNTKSCCLGHSIWVKLTPREVAEELRNDFLTGFLFPNHVITKTCGGLQGCPSFVVQQARPISPRSASGDEEGSMPGHEEALAPEAEAPTPTSLVGDVGALYEQYRGYLLAIAEAELHPRLRQQIGPSDVVQDAFCNVQAKHAQFRGNSEEELRSWLRKILLNQIAETNRRFFDTEKRRLDREESMDQGGVALELAAAVASPSSVVARQEEEELALRAMEHLPPEYRQVIELRNFEQLAFPEIGKQLGRSTAAVYKLWVRAIHKLGCIRESLHVPVPRPDSPGR